ncbi:MAG: hypothetical protein R3B99_34860 [Polyangiales bacterium]
MKRLLVLLAVFSSSTAVAQRDPTRLFPRAAPLVSPDEGLVRLPLETRLLEGARPDLSDLRIFDAEGREVPYLVDRGASAWPDDLPTRLPLEVVGLSERRATREEPRALEEVTVQWPSTPPADATWSLVFDTVADRFVRQVVVRREDPTGSEELARGTIFRLQSPSRARLAIPLPAIAATPETRLVITIEGEGALLSPTLRLEGRREVPAPDVLRIPLTPSSVVREGELTIVDVPRPVGVVPERLVVEADDAHFVRRVQVFDVDTWRGASPLGRGELVRLAELGEEDREVALSRARGERLRVVIDDGDAPSLSNLRFVAEVRRPTLVFVHHEGAKLYVGGGRAGARRHDLEALAGTRRGEALLEQALPEAHAGALHDNPSYDGRPALGFVGVGRAVDASVFAATADLVIEDADEHASRFEPNASLLAHARADLADLRVVDADGNAWPHVLSPAPANLVLPLEVDAAEATAGESVHVLPVTPGPLPAVSLTIDPDEAYVSRDFVLYGVDGRGERRRLDSGALSRGPEDDAPITLAWGEPVVVARFELKVVDGDDRPLVLREASVAVANHTVSVAAPSGSYHVLVGHPDAEPPRYELEDARALVLAVDAATARLGEARANPAYRAPGFWKDASFTTYVVWALLVLAVLGLGALTLRLSREETPEKEDAAAAATEADAAG